jgi:hypothetical protein
MTDGTRRSLTQGEQFVLAQIRAAGAEEIVRPRRLIGRFWAAPQLHR